MGRYSQELVGLAPERAAAEGVIQLALGGPGGADVLASIIETDPSMSARLLRLANSAHHGAPGRVSSVRHAVSLLGEETARAVAANAGVLLLEGAPSRGPDWFWRHSLSTAVATSAVAGRVGYSRRDSYSVGLLHDLGVLLLAPDPTTSPPAGRPGVRPGPARPELGRRRSAPTATARAAAEIERHGTSHAQAGADALEAWSLPQAFVDAVAGHHGSDEPQHALGRLVRVGEALALLVEPVPEHPPTSDVDRLLATVGLPAVARDGLVEEVTVEIQRIISVLGGTA